LSTHCFRRNVLDIKTEVFLNFFCERKRSWKEMKVVSFLFIKGTSSRFRKLKIDCGEWFGKRFYLFIFFSWAFSPCSAQLSVQLFCTWRAICLSSGEKRQATAYNAFPARSPSECHTRVHNPFKYNLTATSPCRELEYDMHSEGLVHSRTCWLSFQPSCHP